MAVLSLVPDTATALRTVGFVRVVSERATIQRLRQVDLGGMATVTQGTLLEVMDREGDWYWVLLEPTEFGTRRPGWIRARDVEEVPAPSPSPPAARAQPPTVGPGATEGDRRDALPTGQESGTTPTSITMAPLDLEVVVRFAFDSSELSDETRTKLDEMVVAMKTGVQRASIEIAGHTDSVGSSAYNMNLGQARAEAVRRYLNARHHIELGQMNVVSYGEDQPAASNGTREGRASNRRVVVNVR